MFPDCPGTTSEQAGKASPCQGCPNQKICASGATKIPDPAIAEIAEKMLTVKHKILVLSGKGGVALLDVDICGPSIPRIMGLDGEQVHQSGSGWSPVNTSQIFPPTTGGAERMCMELGLPMLGKVPLDPRIGRSCDEGRSFLDQVPDSPAAHAYNSIVQSIQDYCSNQANEEQSKD
ncbi:hypothetical protein CRUP_038238 [Coryphaenoides rupestris]|nr:hypothetical protein CRUP_038238 [Coryphaenoides rupestris]